MFYFFSFHLSFSLFLGSSFDLIESFISLALVCSSSVLFLNETLFVLFVFHLEGDIIYQ